MAVVLGSSYINPWGEGDGGPHSNTILHFLKFFLLTMRSPSDIIFIMLKAVT